MIIDVDTIRIAPDVTLGHNVKLQAFVNMYGCTVGDCCRIGTFVEIQEGAAIGRNVEISSHTFVSRGVIIEDGVFIGNGVVFESAYHPSAATADGGGSSDEEDLGIAPPTPTLVKRGAHIESSVIILPGVMIGEEAVVKAGTLVAGDVPPYTVVAGNPARIVARLGPRNLVSHRF